MDHMYFKIFIVFLIMLSSATTSLPVYSIPQTEIMTDSKLTSITEDLKQLDQLPVSDEIFQRMYLVRHGVSTANVYFEIDGKRVRYVSGESPSVPLTENG